jgi:hypothetical protein
VLLVPCSILIPLICTHVEGAPGLDPISRQTLGHTSELPVARRNDLIDFHVVCVLVLKHGVQSGNARRNAVGSVLFDSDVSRVRTGRVYLVRVEVLHVRRPSVIQIRSNIWHLAPCALNTFRKTLSGGAPITSEQYRESLWGHLPSLRCRPDENHGDSSDGLWSMYLTEAEKQDAEVTESWKGDTDGILVFVSPSPVPLVHIHRLKRMLKTGLFSATVAAFIIESYQNLSPDSSDTTNALLTQISQQLVNISNGTPLTSVAAQSSQPFKPTASAVRVNVLWFLSLILSLTARFPRH